MVILADDGFIILLLSFFAHKRFDRTTQLRFLNSSFYSTQANEDVVTMMQPFDNMSAQLSAAPLCIAILGQVIYFKMN